MKASASCGENGNAGGAFPPGSLLDMDFLLVEAPRPGFDRVFRLVNHRSADSATGSMHRGMRVSTKPANNAPRMRGRAGKWSNVGRMPTRRPPHAATNDLPIVVGHTQASAIHGACAANSFAPLRRAGRCAGGALASTSATSPWRSDRRSATPAAGTIGHRTLTAASSSSASLARTIERSGPDGGASQA